MPASASGGRQRLEGRDERRQLGHLGGVPQCRLEHPVVGGPGPAEALGPGRRELGVDPAPVVLAQDAAQQSAVLESVDQPGRRAAAQRGRAFTYIAYTLTEVTGFAAGAVPWLLVLFGVGLFAGNNLGGRAADRSVPRTLAVVLGALAVVMGLFALTASSKPATVASLVLMGAFGFATVPGLQMRIMRYAGQAPTLAFGANIAAFNVGNASGAWLGGLTITAGLGFTSTLWVGAALSAAGLVVLAAAELLARRRPVRAAEGPAASGPSGSEPSGSGPSGSGFSADLDAHDVAAEPVGAFER